MRRTHFCPDRSLPRRLKVCQRPLCAGQPLHLPRGVGVRVSVSSEKYDSEKFRHGTNGKHTSPEGSIPARGVCFFVVTGVSDIAVEDVRTDVKKGPFGGGIWWTTVDSVR